MHIKHLLSTSIGLLLTLAACQQQPKKQHAEKVNIKHDSGNTDVPFNPQKVFIYDMGTLETFDDLGIPVAGIPKDFVPKHLLKYKNDPKVLDVGSILQPNLEQVSTLHPDLVVISALHAHDYEVLSSIAPTISLTVKSESYKQSVFNNLNSIGEIFAIKDKTQQQIMVINQQIQDAAARIDASAQKVMILLYNAGAFSAFGSKSRYSFVFTDLKAKSVDHNLQSDIHGTVVSSEYIAHVNPDILFIIDRNAIMPNHQVNPAEIENALVQKTNAFKNKKIYYLDPNIWYLSGGGTYSMKHMIADIVQAY